MSLKSTINRRRKEGESTKAAARRLAADKDAGIGHEAAKRWLANKKPVKKNVKTKEPTVVQATDTNSVKTKRR